MMPRRTVNTLLIDADEMVAALENHDDESQYFLDLRTGEILLLIDESIVGPNDDLEMQLEAEPDRYREINPISSSDAWQVMADFIEQLPDGEAGQMLARAVGLNHPFRRFKDILLDYPKIREQWFVFHERAMLELVRKWLEEEGIEADLKLRVEDKA